MTFRVLISLLFLGFGCNTYAGIIDIAKRPLRVLNVGSEIYLVIEGDLRADTTYQDGKPVLIGMPPFDDKKPYCQVDASSIIPDYNNRKNPLKLNEIEGAVVDENESVTRTRFMTQMQFTGVNADVNITCYSDSKGTYKEMTLGEFEQTFGIHLRYGNLSLGDPGIEIRSSLYGEYDVLTADVLRKYIQLSVLQPIKMIKEKDLPALRVTIAGGKVVDTSDYIQPYCELLYTMEDAKQLPNELILPKGLKLTFDGSISGSYHKDQYINHGFTLITELRGFNPSLQLSCSSSDANKPLRYLGAKSITNSILNWSYTY